MALHRSGHIATKRTISGLGACTDFVSAYILNVRCSADPEYRKEFSPDGQELTQEEFKWLLDGVKSFGAFATDNRAISGLDARADFVSAYILNDRYKAHPESRTLSLRQAFKSPPHPLSCVQSRHFQREKKKT